MDSENACKTANPDGSCSMEEDGLWLEGKQGPDSTFWFVGPDSKQPVSITYNWRLYDFTYDDELHCMAMIPGPAYWAGMRQSDCHDWTLRSVVCHIPNFEITTSMG